MGRLDSAITVTTPNVSATEQAGQLEQRVCLIRSPILATLNALNNEATPSIAFAYLAGFIEAYGHGVAIVDAVAEGLDREWPVAEFPGYQAYGLPFDEIIDRIPETVEVLGFSCMFSGEWPLVKMLIRQVKAHFPSALIVVGGEHATGLTEYTLRDCPEIDVCVRGEGEHPLLAIVEAHFGGKDPRQVGGTAHIDTDGGYIEQGGLPRIGNVDAIPWPKWPEGYLENFWRAGKSYGVQTERDMPIMASRGCPYQCTFCSNPFMWTTRYILRDVEDLIAEVKAYVERYDITALQFYDLTAITKKKWTLEYCKRLMEEGIDIKWSLPSGTRSEALDSEVLQILKQTNCNYLVYAPESGSPETLKKIKKRIDLDRLTQSVIEAKRLGIVVRTNLIIGFPHETRKNMFETIRYGLYLAWKGADEVSINIFSPYPGTEIFQELMSSGKIDLSDDFFLQLTSLNSDYTVFNPLTCNPHVGPREMASYRIGFMLLNYIVGYIRYPSRIWRTLRNVFGSSGQSATVLEHRLKDKLERRRAS